MIRRILLIILLITGSSVFAMSKMERFIVVNNTGQNIIITKEYSDDPSKVFKTPGFRGAPLEWYQDIHDVTIRIQDNRNANTNFRIEDEREYWLIAPDDYQLIVYYIPLLNGTMYTDDGATYRRLDQIPFMDKMRSIFKSLTIATEDGQILITLENLGEQIISKSPTTYREDGSVARDIVYYLELGIRGATGIDLGIERLASEW